MDRIDALEPEALEPEALEPDALVRVRAAFAPGALLAGEGRTPAHPLLYGVTFAFGSNTNREQMLARCPAAVVLGRVRIAGYRLEFFGALDLEPDPNGAVDAVAWRIEPPDERALDAHEGVLRRPQPSYVKVPLCAALPGDVPAHGFVYRMTPPRRARDPRPPAPAYLARVVTGYAQHGLALDGLHAALARATAVR
jgi:hypothetical protein